MASPSAPPAPASQLRHADFLGTAIGLTQTIWIGAIGSLFTFLPLLVGPLRHLREMPQPIEDGARVGRRRRGAVGDTGRRSDAAGGAAGRGITDRRIDGPAPMGPARDFGCQDRGGR